jgi:radical SAM superfamily enzyme YgiQ (UPF0313 family)
MRILLIAANRGEGVMPMFPLGPAYLAGNLGPGHELQALDLFLTPDYRPALTAMVSSFRPQIIGVSVRNLDMQNYYAPVSLLDEPRDLIGQCRELTDAPVVIGGAAVSIVPGEMLSYLGADAAVAGEGETQFRNVVAAVENGAPLESVADVLTPARAAAGATPSRVGEDMTRQRHPDWDLFSLPSYLSRDVPVSVQTKRGCPFRCVYCSTFLLQARSVRLRDPDAVASELEILERDYGAKRVWFIDDNFNSPPAHAEAICQAMIRRGLGLGWLCNLHPGYVSEESVALFKRAGCDFAVVGSESGSDQMLANLKRGYRADAVTRTCGWLKEAGIDHWAGLLVGGPGETSETLEESLMWMEGLEPTSATVWVGIRIHPQTGLADIARLEGVIDDSTNLLFPTFYLSPAVAPMIEERMTQILAAHPNWSCNAVPGGWRPMRA